MYAIYISFHQNNFSLVLIKVNIFKTIYSHQILSLALVTLRAGIGAGNCTPLLPGKSHGRRSLVGFSPWGCEESETTERLHFHFSLFTFSRWRSKWQPTPVFLPGESQGRGSLVGCHLWGRTESETTEVTQQQQQQQPKLMISGEGNGICIWVGDEGLRGILFSSI